MFKACVFHEKIAQNTVILGHFLIGRTPAFSKWLRFEFGTIRAALCKGRVIMERLFHVIAIQLFCVSVTSAAIVEGQFSLYVTDPGSEPLNVPFSGTFTFDTESNPTFWGDYTLYNVPVISATLTGGDSGDACCYVLDPSPVPPQIVYRREGEPWSVNLFFRNTTLNGYVNVVSPNVGSPQTDPSYGLHWSEAVYIHGGAFGNRGGIYTFTAPTLPSIPEPSAIVACVAVSFVVGTLYRFPHRRGVRNGLVP